MRMRRRALRMRRLRGDRAHLPVAVRHLQGLFRVPLQGLQVVHKGFMPRMLLAERRPHVRQHVHRLPYALRPRRMWADTLLRTRGQDEHGVRVYVLVLPRDLPPSLLENEGGATNAVSSRDSWPLHDQLGHRRRRRRAPLGWHHGALIVFSSPPPPLNIFPFLYGCICKRSSFYS